MTNEEKNELHMVARDEASKVILQHLSLCPFGQLDIEKRLRTIELNYARLIGFMVGSGLIGGAAGGALIKALSS